jgi:hypothetical protein
MGKWVTSEGMATEIGGPISPVSPIDPSAMIHSPVFVQSPHKERGRKTPDLGLWHG